MAKGPIEWIIFICLIIHAVFWNRKTLLNIITAGAFSFTCYFIALALATFMPLAVAVISVFTLMILISMRLFKDSDWQKDFFKSWF